MESFVSRSSFVAACAASTAYAFSGSPLRAESPAVPVADEPYDLVTSSGTIYGSLRLPARKGPRAVALIVAGSGPTDRNGNSAGLATDAYEKLASGLAAAGIASVRFDKRGIAASHAALTSESDIRFDDYVNDTALWIEKLRGDARFERVAIAGHSEGSLVGMIAAGRKPVDAYLSLEGAGFPIGAVLRKQLAPQLAPYPDLAAQSERILASLETGTTVAPAEVPAPLMTLFRPSVQPYLISWLRYDPRVEIRKVRGAVTIVQGTHDIQVSLDDGRALATARPDAHYVVIDGMTHVLVDDPGTTIAQQQAVYTAGTALPLDATLLATVIGAVRAS